MNENKASDQFPPIGFIKTIFNEKVGVPRQPMLAIEARGILKLNPDPAFELAVQCLESFSHIWIIFVFHQNLEKNWHPMIETPRLDVPGKIGVFATRSPLRPNSIGLSAIKLEKIDLKAEGGIEIHLSGVDFLNGTPVLDIKPYIPYADIISEATEGWAKEEIPRYPVSFSKQSLEIIERDTSNLTPDLKKTIEELLSLDARSISQKKSMPFLARETEGSIFRFRVSIYDVEWQVHLGHAHVLRIYRLDK